MTSITCPWCDTTYTQFQPKCPNCGGALSAPVEQAAPDKIILPIPRPLPAPRPAPPNYIRRNLLTDAGAIVALVFLILGVVFSLVGGVLTVLIITAIVGVPFLLLGLLFLAASIPLMGMRYNRLKKRLEVIQTGEVADADLVGVEENLHVRVNGRHPWSLMYRFQVLGREYAGKTVTLTPPGPQFQPGSRVYVLYQTDDPTLNLLYPSPDMVDE
jgi:hypothetical protein